MKNIIKNTIAILAVAISLVSCSNNDSTATVDELEGISKFKEISNATHTIELYSHMTVEQGYNEIKIRIKDNSTNEYVKNAVVNWMPLMHMTMMTHSCPKSGVEKITADGTLYEGYIVFQMAQNATEYWDLKIDYSVNGTNYSVTTVIDVPAATERNVNSFTGSDGIKYIVAYAEPHHLKVALNDMVVGIFKMQDMMNFPVVDGYTLKIDPRMPSMGNHSSPNNVNPTQIITGDLYTGKMALTMTGYWKINLQLVNANGEVVKGEEISDTVLGSSIYFDFEF